MASDAILQMLQELLQSEMNVSDRNDPMHLPFHLPPHPSSRFEHHPYPSFSFSPSALDETLPRNPAPSHATHMYYVNHLMQLYHTNILEYQRALSLMFVHLRTIQPRQQNTVLADMVYPYNRNIQEYHGVMHECIALMHSLIHPTDASGPAATTPAVPSTTAATPTTTPAVPSSFFDLRPYSPIIRLRNPAAAATVIPSRAPFMMGTLRMPVQQQHPVAQAILSQEQIRLATTNHIFHRSDVLAEATENRHAPSATVCPISLEEFREGDLITEIRHCRHRFHSGDLYRWFTRDSRCPVCRYNLWDISNAGIPPAMDGSAAAPPPRRPRSASESVLQLTQSPPSDAATWTPLVFQERPATEPTPPAAATTETLVRQLLSSFIQPNVNAGAFTNMDVDITYSIEYDTSGNVTTHFPSTLSGRASENA